MDVSLLQVEAAGHGAVADSLCQQGEGQQDGVGQRQTSPASQTCLGFGALKQLSDVLRRQKSSISSILVWYIRSYLWQIYRLLINQSVHCEDSLCFA